MKISDCFYLGYIAKAIGNHGELSLVLDTDSPQYYTKMGSIQIRINKRDDELVPFFVSRIVIDKKKARITVEDIKTNFQAKELVGKEVYLPIEDLKELKGNQFYFHEVVGFKVIDENFGEVGIIKEILDYPAQAVIYITHKDKQVLIPIIKGQTIKKVDRKNKTINLTSPEGLIEMYING